MFYEYDVMMSYRTVVKYCCCCTENSSVGGTKSRNLKAASHDTAVYRHSSSRQCTVLRYRYTYTIRMLVAYTSMYFVRGTALLLYILLYYTSFVHTYIQTNTYIRIDYSSSVPVGYLVPRTPFNSSTEYQVLLEHGAYFEVCTYDIYIFFELKCCCSVQGKNTRNVYFCMCARGGRGGGGERFVSC